MLHGGHADGRSLLTSAVCLCCTFKQNCTWCGHDGHHDCATNMTQDSSTILLPLLQLPLPC